MSNSFNNNGNRLCSFCNKKALIGRQKKCKECKAKQKNANLNKARACKKEARTCRDCTAKLGDNERQHVKCGFCRQQQRLRDQLKANKGKNNPKAAQPSSPCMDHQFEEYSPSLKKFTKAEAKCSHCTQSIPRNRKNVSAKCTKCTQF